MRRPITAALVLLSASSTYAVYRTTTRPDQQPGALAVLGAAARSPSAMAPSPRAAASHAARTQHRTPADRTASSAPVGARTAPATPSPLATTPAGPTRTPPRTFTGSVVDTQYGPVQVTITVTDGKITAASAVQYPNDNPHSQQINSYAVPVLQQETVQADSSSIAAVSGASYTSAGYVQSLQSAIDQAHR